LLGFAATDLPYEIGEGGKHKYFKSPSPANFDAASLYLLKCSVLSGQNYDASGSGGGQVRCAITPTDVPPGDLIQYRPSIPLPCQAHALKGNRTSSIRFTMADNDGDAVALNEAYTARILISLMVISVSKPSFFLFPSLKRSDCTPAPAYSDRYLLADE
jgi:hypothetical protein